MNIDKTSLPGRSVILHWAIVSLVIGDLCMKYFRLIEMKSNMEDMYYELSEEHKVMSMERQLIKNN